MSEQKKRVTFTLSKEVVTALRKHVAIEVAEGKRETAFGAESAVVEEALRKKLGLTQEKEGSDEDNYS